MVSQRRYASRRHSSIQAGSFFFAEIKRTVSSDKPLGALSDSINVSNPYRYWSTSIRRTRSTVSCTAGILFLRSRFQGPRWIKLERLLRCSLAERNLLRTVQAVFRRSPLSRLLASFRQALRHESMSSSIVDQPRLSRTAPWATSRGYPIASSTWDGCTLPEEQAEPEDTATPSRSKPITAVSAFSPGTANSVVLGNRGARSENTMAPLVWRRPVSRRARRDSRRT